MYFLKLFRMGAHPNGWDYGVSPWAIVPPGSQHPALTDAVRGEQSRRHPTGPYLGLSSHLYRRGGVGWVGWVVVVVVVCVCVFGQMGLSIGN